jgi:ferredoxin
MTDMFVWLKYLLFGNSSRDAIVANKSCCSSRKSEIPSEPQRRIKNVWIEPGCVVCGSCEVVCPPVFVLGEDTAALRPDAPLHFDQHREAIEQARDYCCVEVIKISY